jgi:hypothetical protein
MQGIKNKRFDESFMKKHNQKRRVTINQRRKINYSKEGWYIHRGR